MLVVFLTWLALTLCGAMLAFFITRIDKLVDLSSLSKGVVTVSAVCFTASIIAGPRVLMRATTMLGQGKYDPQDKALKVPGVINVIALGVGAMCFSGYLLSASW